MLAEILNFQGTNPILGMGSFSKEQERDVELEVWQCGIPKKTVLERVIISNETGYSLMPKQYEVADGVLKISLQKYSAVILMYDRSEN